MENVIVKTVMANQSTNLIFASVLIGIAVIMLIVQIVLFVRSNQHVERERKRKEKKQTAQVRRLQEELVK
jgi:heme/copper-type cytochrome/quinol oxidase subunit 2